MSSYRHLVWVIAILATSCNGGAADSIECNYWGSVLRDEALSGEILGWMDLKVFGRVFADSDRSFGKLVFPGRHGAIRAAALGESPFSLMGSEIRPIYFRQDGSVGGVFVGRKNSVGIFIDFLSVEGLVVNSEIAQDAFEWKANRLALSCGDDGR